MSKNFRYVYYYRFSIIFLNEFNFLQFSMKRKRKLSKDRDILDADDIIMDFQKMNNDTNDQSSKKSQNNKDQVNEKVKDKKIIQILNLCYDKLTIKGILSMSDVFDIALQVYPKKVWSSPFLDFLSHAIISDGRISRIDLALPSSKPLAIYPGHHAVSSTSFFCLSSDNSNEKLAEAESILNNLCKEINEKNLQKKKESNKKKVNNKNNTESIQNADSIDSSLELDKIGDGLLDNENDLSLDPESHKLERKRKIARNYQAKIRWGIIVPKSVKLYH